MDTASVPLGSQRVGEDIDHNMNKHYFAHSQGNFHWKPRGPSDLPSPASANARVTFGLLMDSQRCIRDGRFRADPLLLTMAALPPANKRQSKRGKSTTLIEFQTMYNLRNSRKRLINKLTAFLFLSGAYIHGHCILMLSVGVCIPSGRNF